MSNLQINTRVRRLFNYLDDFERGKIQVPPFQRDFVWSNEKKLELMDSLKNGFPIGSVLFWQPESDVMDLVDEEIQSIGSYQLTIRGNDFYYILDGYQRLSTLFGCFIDSQRTILLRDDKKWKSGFDIVYNLKSDKFEFNKKTVTGLEIYQIPLYHFIDGEQFYDFQTGLTEMNISDEEKKTYIRRYKNFGSKITSYDIPSIDLIGGTIKDAVEIFSRLNSRGEKISDDWKVSALSFSRERNFRFGSEIDILFNRLEKYNFFIKDGDRKSKRELVLQCVATSFGRIYFDVSGPASIEELATKDNFIDVCRKAMNCIEKAVKFLYEELLVLDSSLLPYNSQLIFITDFFFKVQYPSKSQLNQLKKWFWVTTYSNYFTIYNLSKQRLAYESFQAFIINQNSDPIFYDKYDKFATVDFPKKINMKSVRAKALALFMLNYSVRRNEIMRADAIPSEQINFYDICKLYNKTHGIDGVNKSENTVLYVHLKNEQSNFFTIDDTFTIIDPSKDVSSFFITNQMMQAPYDVARMLELRLDMIKIEEGSFVQSLNMRYSFE